MILLNIENNKFLEQKKYVFDLIFTTIGIPYKLYDGHSDKDDIIITYSKGYKLLGDKKEIYIKDSQNLFNEGYLKEIPKYNVKRIKLESNIKYMDDIVTIFADKTPKITKMDNATIIDLDIISDIFFMVTRYEELLIKEKDSHNRFECKSSLAYKEEFIDRPIVNEQIELLWSEIKRLDKNIEKIKWWDESKFAFFVSHDIDSIFKYKDKILRVLGIKLLKEKSIKAFSKSLLNYLKVVKDSNNDPFWTFDYLISLEKKNNFTASYYFMTGGETNKDRYYRISSSKLKEVFLKIKEAKSEVGLHGSYNSFNNDKLLASEKIMLDRYFDVKGIRQHYLRFQVPVTWELQEKNGFIYDTTLAYAQVAGFRAGICTPYKVYNLLKDEVMELWEIPLILMDGTVKDKEYMGLSVNEALEYTKKLIDKVSDMGGVFSLLWHNSNFDYTVDGDEWKMFYEEIFSYANKSNAVGLSGEKIIDNFKKKCKVIDK